jgi:hypothetical protein
MARRLRARCAAFNVITVLRLSRISLNTRPARWPAVRRQRTVDIGDGACRHADRSALHLDVVGVQHLERRDHEIAGDADAGIARIHGATRREQH